MKMKRITLISACLLPITCAMPPVNGFWDERVVPKWYASLFLLLLFSVVSAFYTQKIGRRELLTGIRLGAVLGVCMQLCYVVGECWLMPQHVWAVGVQGTFDNPAMLALFLCLLLPCLYPRRWMTPTKRRFFLVVLLLAVVLLLLTQSRTGLLALSLMVMVWTIRHWRCRAWLRTGTALMLAAMVLCFVFTRKTDSTRGRLFILQRTWELIQRHPFSGYGIMGFSREYMPCQADYFRRHTKSAEAMLADDVRHPLNEFMWLWVDSGIICLLAILGVFALALWISHRHALFYSLLVLLVFSCFSYPFHQPLSWVVLGAPFALKLAAAHVPRSLRYGLCGVGTLLLACLVYRFALDCAWSRAARNCLRGQSREMLPVYARLYPHFVCHPYFLYNYAAELYQAGLFSEAAKTLRECRQQMDGYYIELLSGDVCRQLGECPMALRSYWQARWMCPARFAPLEGLLHVYLQQGDSLSAEHISSVIRRQQMKVPSVDALRIKHEAENSKNTH